MTSATSDWEQAGDQYFRRVQLYKDVFDEDLELENYIVVGAQCGGALALYRDESKIHAYRGSASAKSAIDLYSCSGKLYKSINWDKGSIKACGWSADEQLLIVTVDGAVRCYSDLQGEFSQFSLGNGAEEHGVVSCRFGTTGFVALLANNSLISVSNYSEPRPTLLATPPKGEVRSWTIIPPANTMSRSVEVLLSIDSTVHVVDPTESEDRMLQNGPFSHIAVSSNGDYTALHAEDGKLWIIRSDFQEKLGEYDPKIKTPVSDMQWSGNDAVILAWEDELHIVGLDGSSSQHYYNERIHLVPDIDGVRVISNEVCEFIQRVPHASEEVFRLGSDSPASVLLDTVSLLESQSPKALTNMSLISSSLPEAVDTCTQAAINEFSTEHQKQLLKAASFGKSTIDLYPASDFVDACTKLRVLTALRFYKIGLPLSSEQYDRLGPDGIVDRLITRGEFLLALRISEYLSTPTNRIYSAWATQKVRTASTDEDVICSAIVTKLGGTRGVSFEQIARAAYDEGRPQLATQLLNHEPRAGKQVPLLLSMEEDELALDKALQSGDTDLTLFVLLQLKAKLKASTFFRMLSTRPVALSLVTSTARHADPDLLKDLYYQDDRRLDTSLLLLRSALSAPTPQERQSELRLASKNLDASKPYTFQHNSLQTYSRLLTYQESLTTQHPTDPPYSNLSLYKTYSSLTLHSHPASAAKLASSFKIPDKTTAWLRLRALVAARDWSTLAEIPRQNKKSPIGWKPYFEEILAAGNVRLAGEFVARINERGVAGREKVEMFLKCGLVGKVAEEAYRVKDGALLEELRGREGEGRADVERYLGLMGK
ncbi:MAG: hypothetical protein M1814_003667 [Vezdaea aestivalis]|nr:MAG: hypothetical protein M1814_003667 [Vezdaea aestivalis]